MSPTLLFPLTRLPVALLCTALSATAAPTPGVDTPWRCDARSGGQRAALVELYTSEGCSSCPPADAQMADLARALGPQAVVVPLALHVDYWDAIGWADPYAQAPFPARQRALVQAGGGRTVYTPHWFVGAAEVRGQGAGLRDAVRATNAQAPGADLLLRAGAAPDGALSLQVQAGSRQPQPADRLMVAVTESGLVSRVSRGENAGRTLGHANVVRAWLGPFALGADGRLDWRQTLPLPAGWRRDALSVVAFVQRGDAGPVLQAVRAAGCAAP